ncbi:SAP-like protein BP-73-like [Hibiscus syriacus]|uniref:SAP-like protein BP-73-like n=1 Tax=Hibiscus syriacus TaxID=106335 RepID=A0A6A2XW79_HIBSY|nr:SAP-like protein BP-73-like [Hibiscus syriacus]
MRIFYPKNIEEETVLERSRHLEFEAIRALKLVLPTVQSSDRVNIVPVSWSLPLLNWCKILGFSTAIGICSIVEAELWGVHEGLTHAWNLGERQVMLEVDSLEWNVNLKRAANQVANKLAKMAGIGGVVDIVFSTPPLEVASLLQQDYSAHDMEAGKLTFLHWSKGEAMAPTIGEQGGTLLVRKIQSTDPNRIFVGDVIVVKDPENSDNYLVRRLAATEGYETVSKDEKDEPFVLEKDQCWDAKDSRVFGPVPMTDIVGRVIYCLRTAVDHGPLQNSHYSMRKDSPVLEVELDIDGMVKNHKA